MMKLLNLIDPATLQLVLILGSGLCVVWRYWRLTGRKFLLVLSALGLGVVLSSVAILLLNLMIFRPPADYSGPIPNKRFDFSIEKQKLSDSGQFSALMVPGGMRFGVFRGKGCSASNPAYQDHRNCEDGSYAIFRAEVIPRGECEGKVEKGVLSDLISISDESARFLVDARSFPEGWEVGQRSGSQWVQICVEYVQVDSVPNDAVWLADISNREYDGRYVLSKQVRGLVNFRYNGSRSGLSP